MQPTRTLSDIIASLNSVYQPQIDLYRQQQDAIPGQAQAQTDALGAKKDQAFSDILAGARRRGVGFSGIPLGEQAKYLATDYAPALANLQTANTDRATSLEQAILQIQQQQNQQAQGIYQTEQDRAEQARQFNANLAAQREAAARQSASLGGLFGGGSAPTAPSSPLSLQGATLKNAQAGASGGYNFSFGGKPISAVGFAGVNNLNPADVLYSMANAGDAYAAQAYRDIVNNGGKITPQLAQKYSALFWGTNFIPAATTQTAPKPNTVSPMQNVQNNSKKSTTALLFGGK